MLSVAKTSMFAYNLKLVGNILRNEASKPFLQTVYSIFIGLREIAEGIGQVIFWT